MTNDAPLTITADLIGAAHSKRRPRNQPQAGNDTKPKPTPAMLRARARALEASAEAKPTDRAEISTKPTPPTQPSGANQSATAARQSRPTPANRLNDQGEIVARVKKEAILLRLLPILKDEIEKGALEAGLSRNQYILHLLEQATKERLESAKKTAVEIRRNLDRLNGKTQGQK